MKLSDFKFDLPEHLIAQFPLPNRSDSRLMVVDGVEGTIRHAKFRSLLDLLRPGDLLVLNDTKVIPARLFGKKLSGGRIEVMLERIVDQQHVLAKVRASKSPKAGAKLLLADCLNVEVVGRDGEFFKLRFDVDSVIDALQEHGHMPLPPYIKRQDVNQDRKRYQTVFAKHDGAVAAPTAGLHFDKELLAELKSKGVDHEFVTLHVGAGTFQPVRCDNLDEHIMHSEYVDVGGSVCQRIADVKARGGRVVAVGTTVVRSLESAAADGTLKPFQGDTRIFIKPGSAFHVIDAMVTNFHLPESTLLMLISAFAGYDLTLSAYREAVAEAYRFFSYGDAMFVLPDVKTWSQDAI